MNEITLWMTPLRGVMPPVIIRHPPRPHMRTEHGNRGNVIVVDDDEEVRELLHEILSDEGYRVFTVADAREALATMRKVPGPRVALVDLMMPDVDGWDLIDLMKRDVRAQMPVIVFTGKGRAPVRGSQRIVAKPCKVEFLLETIDEYLRS